MKAFATHEELRAKRAAAGAVLESNVITHLAMSHLRYNRGYQRLYTMTFETMDNDNAQGTSLITTGPVAPLTEIMGKNRANFVSDISQSMSTPLNGICATEPTAMVTNQTFLLMLVM